MSYRKEKIMSLTGQEVNGLNQSELKAQCEQFLDAKMHGICFSPYEGTQVPGDPISEAQVRRKLELLVPHTEWIRVFSCTQGNEIIPKLAKEYGFKTLVGAWLGEEADKNEEELQGLISLASAGYVDVAAVGNEVMYREELEEEELVEYILRAKQALKGIPVGYVDAYYEFTNRPKITEVCDVILANCYPYWEACHIDYSLLYMKQMYYQAVQAASGKRVIITETGWPSSGDALGAAEPGYENALKYFINAQAWSQQEGIEMFYFSAFDEGWKVGAEGKCGCVLGAMGCQRATQVLGRQASLKLQHEKRGPQAPFSNLIDRIHERRSRDSLSLQRIARPINSFPSMASSAASASAWFGISTKPKPRLRPVSRSWMTLARSTSP